MSLRCVRTAGAAAGRRVSTPCTSSRYVWLNATSFPCSASLRPPPLTRMPSIHHHIRRFTTNATTTAPPPTTAPAATALAAVHSMSELRDTVERAAHRLVILEWKATWCGKCKIVAAELQRLQSKYGDGVVVRTVDIEEGDLVEGKKEAGIDHLPVLHFIKDGELVHEIVGVRTNEMGKTVEKYVGEQKAATSQPV